MHQGLSGSLDRLTLGLLQFELHGDCTLNSSCCCSQQRWSLTFTIGLCESTAFLLFPGTQIREAAEKQWKRKLEIPFFLLKSLK